MICCPSFSASWRRKSYRSLRAASSRERPSRSIRPRTSPELETKAMSWAAHQSRTKVSSRSASAPRSWWLKWAATTRPSRSRHHRSSRSSRHMESSPPDTAHRAGRPRPGSTHRGQRDSSSSMSVPHLSQNRPQSSSYLVSKVENWVYSGIHRSSTLPVSPWRFFATMHSAMLCFSESSL